MKNYLFAIGCLVVSIVLQVFRGYPGVVADVLAGAILLTSFVTTFLGVRAAVDDMKWRMAIAILAPAIIGFATNNLM
jgi:hypothetical protein